MLMRLFYLSLAALLAILIITYFRHRQEQKRIAKFEQFAMATNDNYYHGEQSKQFYNRLAGSGHELFQIGSDRKVNHLFEVPFNQGEMIVFEYQYTYGGGDDDGIHRYHAVLIDSAALPTIQFLLEPKLFKHQIKAKLGLKSTDINFEMYPDFSKRFFLQGEDEAAVRSLFSDDVIRWFENQIHSYQASLHPSSLLLYWGGALRFEGIEILKRDGVTLYDQLAGPTKLGTVGKEYRDEHDW